MGLRELFGLRGARDKPTNSYNSGNVNKLRIVPTTSL